MNSKISVDVIIIGGGIAGLFTLNRLKNLGFSAILLESEALGSGQTLKSQGIIHGGIKYALKGFLNSSANAVESMPSRWKACLEGKGELDLSQVKILSEQQFLWSTGSLSSEVTTFFASFSLQSRVKKLKATQYPEILQNPAFKGQVYRLEEWVLDIPSLVKNLSQKYLNSMLKIDAEDGVQWLKNNNNNNNNSAMLSNNPNSEISGIRIHNKTQMLEISAKRYLITAGEGFRKLGKHLSLPMQMQCRPLHMVIVKFKQQAPLFAHCIDSGMNPRITVTTHKTLDNQIVWYLGGQIAETGVEKSKAEQCQFAKLELTHLFPWIDFNNASFDSFFINRAEHQEPNNKRPDSFYLNTEGNISTAWPTKLALTPLLTDAFLKSLQKENIIPSPSLSDETGSLLVLEQWERPALALPPWEE